MEAYPEAILAVLADPVTPFEWPRVEITIITAVQSRGAVIGVSASVIRALGAAAFAHGVTVAVSAHRNDSVAVEGRRGRRWRGVRWCGGRRWRRGSRWTRRSVGTASGPLAIKAGAEAIITALADPVTPREWPRVEISIIAVVQSRGAVFVAPAPVIRTLGAAAFAHRVTVAPTAPRDDLVAVEGRRLRHRRWSWRWWWRGRAWLWRATLAPVGAPQVFAEPALILVLRV